MSTQRRSTSSATNNNFRPQNDTNKRGEGTKPVAKPISVGETLLTMFLHGCRKVVFVNTNLRILAYWAILFVSFVGDIYPFPRSYFSRSSNALNQYFVKLGWMWTLIATVPFVLITSFTYCCGNRKMVGSHLTRLGVATVVWFVVTKSFFLFENNTGKCNVKGDKFDSKQSCLAAGYFWHSIDISGHAFILIYSCLIIIEESRIIIGWDTIQDLIRHEDHLRQNNESDLSSPLKILTQEELGILKLSFKTFTPYVRGMFIAMTFLILLWDVMILSTALYFHIMIEKLIAGFIAVVMWYITYKIWFNSPKLPPFAPGIGSFQYNKPKLFSNGPLPRAAQSKRDLPTFMGMPLFSQRNDQSDEPQSGNKGPRSSSTPSPRQGPVTRSQVASRTLNETK